MDLEDETIEWLLNTFPEIYCREAVVWRTAQKNKWKHENCGVSFLPPKNDLLF